MSGAPERGNPTLRLLDRYVGIPLLASADLARRRRPLPEAIRRIGIFKSSAIGDTVLLSAIVRDLSAALPDAQITFFAGRDNAAVARLIDEVEVVTLPMSRPLEAARTLRRHPVDVLLDFGPWPRIEALLSALSHASYTVGFRTPGQHRHRLYDAVVSHSGGRHELENYRALVGAIGVESLGLPRIEPRGAPSAPPPPEPYVVFHMWAGGYRSHLKEWPSDRWQDLAARVVESGCSVALTGSRSDADRCMAFIRLSGGLGRHMVDLSGTGFDELLPALRGSSAVVSVNTGLMHLAAASGARTVGLNGPTAELRWGPLGERARSVSSAYEGCGFLNLGFEYDGQRDDCMRGISVARVHETMTTLLDDE